MNNQQDKKTDLDIVRQHMNELGVVLDPETGQFKQSGVEISIDNLTTLIINWRQSLLAVDDITRSVVKRNLELIRHTDFKPSKDKPAVRHDDPNRVKTDEDLVKQHNIELGVELDSETGQFHLDGDTISVDDITTEIVNHRQRLLLPRINRDAISSNLYRITSKTLNVKKAETITRIQFDPSCIDTSSELIDIICPQETTEEDRKFYSVVIRQVIWRVKRSLTNRVWELPLLVSFYGEKHAGKGEFVSRLLSPLAGTLHKKIENLDVLYNDPRWTKAFQENYVLCVEELTGLSRTNMDTLKSTIDSPYLTHRILGTDRVIKISNHAQLIGTSNERIRDTIAAEFNLRKFAEIDFAFYGKDQQERVWDKINSFDFLGLWKSVDENQDKSPLNSVWYEFDRWTQSKCVRRTPAHLWLSKMVKEHGGEELTAQELQESLTEYYDQLGTEKQFRAGKNKLSSMLKHLGAEFRHSRRGRMYTLPTIENARLYVENDEESDNQVEEINRLKVDTFGRN